MKGLSFNGELMKAWLAGNKAVTRRPMRPQPYFQPSGACGYPTPASHGNKRWRHYASEKHFRRGIAQDFAPYLPGETVYIKETVRAYQMPVEAAKGGSDGVTTHIEYSDGTESKCWAGIKWPKKPINYDLPAKGFIVPSIYMPEWASRSHARIISVRPEREKSEWYWRIKMEKVRPL